MNIGIDVAASGPDRTAYAVRDPETGNWLHFNLPEGGEWRFLPWRDHFVAVNSCHEPLLVSLRSTGVCRGLTVQRLSVFV